MSRGYSAASFIRIAPYSRSHLSRSDRSTLRSLATPPSHWAKLRYGPPPKWGALIARAPTKEQPPQGAYRGLKSSRKPRRGKTRLHLAT